MMNDALQSFCAVTSVLIQCRYVFRHTILPCSRMVYINGRRPAAPAVGSTAQYESNWRTSDGTDGGQLTAHGRKEDSIFSGTSQWVGQAACRNFNKMINLPYNILV